MDRLSVVGGDLNLPKPKPASFTESTTIKNDVTMIIKYHTYMDVALNLLQKPSSFWRSRTRNPTSPGQSHDELLITGTLRGLPTQMIDLGDGCRTTC